MKKFVIAGGLVLLFGIWFGVYTVYFRTQTITPVELEEPITEERFVYFITPENVESGSCDQVTPVVREVESSLSIEKTILEELLAGPAEKEVEAGMTSAIPEQVSVINITVDEGVARANFSTQLNEGVAGSCLVTAIRAQIEQTLLQFLDIEEVEIAVDGETKEILQP